MKVAPEKQYFLKIEGKTKGPVSGTHLKVLGKAGTVNGRTSIRVQGEQRWMPASVYEGLVSGPSAKKVAGAVPALNPLGTTNNVSFSYYFVLSVAAFLLVVVCQVQFILSYVEAEVSSRGRLIPDRGYRKAAMLTFYYAMAIEVFSFIFALIIVSRAWRVLQGLPGVRTEPDLAAWNLLIPVYNIYWSFVAWHVWACDYERYRLTLKNPRVPKVGDNVFLVPLVMYYACLALLLLIYLLSLQSLILLVLLNIILIACAVLWWMAVYQMCQATNFLAELQRMSPGRQ